MVREDKANKLIEIVTNGNYFNELVYVDDMVSYCRVRVGDDTQLARL